MINSTLINTVDLSRRPNLKETIMNEVTQEAQELPVRKEGDQEIQVSQTEEFPANEQEKVVM